MKTFTIKDLADLFDNTRGGIRFYEEKGLLAPKRDNSGNRYYDALDILQLFYLKRYCSVGCSLNEVISYFRSDNKNELADIQHFITAKEAEIQAEIARYENQLAWLKHYQLTFSRCQNGINQLTPDTIGDFYYLDQTYLNDWSPVKARIMKQWIQAAPKTTIHVDLIPQMNGTYSKLIGIGIMKNLAAEIGLEVPLEVKLLPGSKVFRTIIQSSGEDFQLTCDRQVNEFVAAIRRMGHVPHLFPSLTLIFSNNIQEKIKYYELFIPIK